MDKAARKKLNLKAIRRYDPAIVNILDQSPHAVLYYFSNEKREWVKKSVEGVLFLVQRKIPPYFAVYIMNRLAMENYTLYLTDFDDMDLQQNFIIYSTSDGERYAFWLYEEGDRQRLLTKITKLHDGIKKELSAKSNQKATTTTNVSMPEPSVPNQPNQLSSSSSTSPRDSTKDLWALLTRNLPVHHHPPNEYGPERTEQPSSKPSPTILQSFSDTQRNHGTSLPPSGHNDASCDFILPSAKLMQPQSNDTSDSARLMDLLKKGTMENDTQRQSHGPSPPSQQHVQPPGDNGNRLLELLKRATVDDKIQHMPSPPLPPASLGYGTLPVHYNQQMGHPPTTTSSLPHPSASSSTPNTNNTMPPPHILFGKELTKAYQPAIPMMDPRHQQQQQQQPHHQPSPRNSASLLQALQGGMIGGHSSQSNLGPISNIHQQQQGYSSATSSIAALHGSPGPTLSSSTTSASSFNGVNVMDQQQQPLQQHPRADIDIRMQSRRKKMVTKEEYTQAIVDHLKNRGLFDLLYRFYKEDRKIENFSININVSTD
ncbi:uncharacterized protein BX664DRAFT_324285, partial [Halteromyces radiatus]|uniref:uncharacterized protein n=1 Tax=Halteromyces radiatus TaxID=101107 RepID=UPI00221EC813